MGFNHSGEGTKNARLPILVGNTGQSRSSMPPKGTKSGRSFRIRSVSGPKSMEKLVLMESDETSEVSAMLLLSLPVMRLSLMYASGAAGTKIERDCKVRKAF